MEKELNFIDLNDSISFEDLYEKVCFATAYLMRHCAETEDTILVKIVGEPLAEIQQLMSNQKKKQNS